MSTWRFRPFPASAIAFGDGGVQKGGRVNRTLHVSKGRNFQRWKKERCKFPPAIRIVIPSSPPFISFIFLPLESENFLQKDAESFHLLEPVYTKNRGFRGFGESLIIDIFLCRQNKENGYVSEYTYLAYLETRNRTNFDARVHVPFDLYPRIKFLY